VNLGLVMIYINEIRTNFSRISFSLILKFDILYLNPIVIRVSNESNSLHGTISQSLDKLDTKRLETFTSLFNIINKDSDMTETLSRFFVTVGILEIGLIFSTPVAKKVYALINLTF
jgi:hypothetical protein